MKPCLASIRRHAPRRAAAAVVLAACCAGPRAPAGDGPGAAGTAPAGSLRFLNGDRLTGELAGLDAVRGLAWRHPASEEPLRFACDRLDKVQLAPPAPRAADAAAGVELANGDRLAGRLVRFEDGTMLFDAAGAGRLRLPRAALRRFTPPAPEAADAAAADGPARLSGWVVPENYGSNAWVAVEGGIGSDLLTGTVGRPLPGAADRFAMDLDVAWPKGVTHLSFALLTDTKRRLGYTFGFAPGAVRIFRRGFDVTFGREKPVVLAGGLPLAEAGEAHLSLRVDRQRSRAALLIDGRLVGSWDSRSALPEPLAWMEVRVTKWPPGEDRWRFTNVRVRDWDGESGTKPVEVEAGRDGISLVNGDTVAGRLLSVKGDLLTFETEGSEIELPLGRVLAVTFAAAPGGGAGPVAGTGVAARVELANGSHLSVALDAIDGDTVKGRSPLLGPVAVPRAAVAAIVFNPDRPPEGPAAPAPATPLAGARGAP